MEPWPFSHGYRDRLATTCRCGPTFNGAMALQPWIPGSTSYDVQVRANLQWSHGPSAMDTRRAHAPLPQVRLLQWSHGPSAMDTCEVIDAIRARDFPSMEPWPFSHGYISAVVSQESTYRTFNGAMALQPWIRAQRAGAYQTGISPSMEPWPFSHGYQEVFHLHVILSFYLQWSHGPSAMDTWPAMSRLFNVNALQWSHGPSAMDTRQGRLRSAPLR